MESTITTVASPGYRNELSPRFMLRVAGLPIEAVQRLRCAELYRRSEELLTEEERLVATGSELSDRIGALVRGLEDDGLRRRLLALRRQLFNNRLPADVPVALRLAAELGGPVGEALATWLTDRREYAAARLAATAGYEQDLAASRAELRAVAGEERLRLGLLLASPTLEGQVDAFVAAAKPVPDKRGRKLERSLLAYLYRTACKTSPFSTFTSLAPGRFVSGGAAGAEVAVGREWSGHPRLNVLVLARLGQVIAASPEHRGDLPVAPASGLALGEGRVRYVRRSTKAGDDSRSVTFDSAKDRVFFLRRSGILEKLLGLFGEGRELRCAEVLDWLADRADAGPEEAERYLAALLDLGLLQLSALATDVHEHDPLGSFQSSLRALDRPWATGVADRLDGPAAWIADYRTAAAPGRRSILNRLRTELLDIQRELGAAEPSLPQILLYEDVSAAPVAAEREPWEQLAVEPLRELSSVFPAFDPMLPQRLTLKGFFLTRFGRGGRCEDLLTLVHDFHEDIFDRYLEYCAQLPEDGSPSGLNWLRLPELTAMEQAQQQARDDMRALWSALPAGTAEVGIRPEQLRGTAELLAPVPRGFEPQSYFLQLARREHDPLAVLNNSYGGIGFPFTRFTHCFEQPDADGGGTLAAELRGSLRERQPDGAVFAEVTGGSATTNLNLHSPLTDYQIACPGEVSSAPESARLPLDDLYVVHDEDADRLVLRSHRLDREVVPLYFGYLVPEALPEIPRTLLLLSPSFQVRLDLWRGVPVGEAVDGVTSRPRVRYRSLVLHRRSWTADSAVLPVREPGGAEADWYLRWQGWRRRHGLPVQVFARIYQTRPDGLPGADFGSGKPQFVDFASPLSLLALEGALSGKQARVVLEEMLPAEDELQARSTDGSHVAEFAVEFVPVPTTDPMTQEGPA
jgi:hypothetical protein